jgi:hypothetical protein
MAQHLDATYPTIARWVKECGWIEIGQHDIREPFIRAWMKVAIWEGRESHATLDATLQDLEAGLTAWIQHHL